MKRWQIKPRSMRDDDCLVRVRRTFASTQNDFVRAAQLYGAAEAQRQEFGVPRPPVEDAAAEELRAVLRAALGKNFLPTMEQARALTRDDAKELALE